VPLSFPSAQNRFIGGGTTGSFHSAVTASATVDAEAGTCGSAATLAHALQLVFEADSVDVTGGLDLTFSEERANVVLEGTQPHVETRSFAIAAVAAAPLPFTRTDACRSAIARFNALQ
jgi:hypothetical protein